MKDAFGVEIKIGDEVVTIKTKEFNQYSHSDLIKLKVISFTPKGVKLEIGDTQVFRLPHRVAVNITKKDDSRLK